MTKSEARAIAECTRRAQAALSMTDWPEELLVKHGLRTTEERREFYQSVMKAPLDEIKRVAEMADAELGR